MGFRITVDRATRELAPGVWSGGTPARVVRLTAAGSAVWQRLATDAVDSVAAGALARRLTDAGLAHPCPPLLTSGTAKVTIVIPVRDRAQLLDRCLTALGDTYSVVVVDDGSRDPAAVAAVSAAHGATLHRRPVNGGPAAARNTGLAQVSTELVAFVDSDCVPDPGWIDALAGHFADPLVAAVAPRITAAGSTVVGHITTGLDLGGEPARVAPGTRVSYVPTAALVARRRALLAVAGPGGVFDPVLRVGEDVDLVWRLHEAGWRVRYDPTVRVGHHEPMTWPALLSRRMSYGTSGAPLALRHPGSVPPLVLDPWPALAVAALLYRRPLAAGAALAASVLTTTRTLREHDLPTTDALRVTAANTAKTWLGVSRYATQFAAPLLLAGLLRRGHRAAALALLAGPGLAAWFIRRPPLDPLRYVAAAIADDVAYGAGVWAGCIQHRTIAPLRPVVRWPTRKRGRTP
jgi:mycofactocin system glycosyltransferase